MRVGIIGGGPSGFFVADRLLKKDPNILVNIYDASCFPFGLLRYGVAPDHPEIKALHIVPCMS